MTAEAFALRAWLSYAGECLANGTLADVLAALATWDGAADIADEVLEHLETSVNLEVPPADIADDVADLVRQSAGNHRALDFLEALLKIGRPR